ncbi:MAG: hypothetical protein ACKV2V_29830 [Blastocatellia bacterium]
MSKKKSNSVGGISTGINNQRLDVVVTQEKGESVITLQLSSWTDGQGWKVEKKIPMAAAQLGQLQRLLSQARGRIIDQHAAPEATGQVIPIGARRTPPAATIEVVADKGRRRKIAN